MPYQPRDRTQKTGPTSLANHSMSRLEMPLYLSLEYARQAAESLPPPYSLLPSQLSAGVSPASVEGAEKTKDQIQDLRTLAQWPPLHDPVLPPPIVGDIESDPCGVADRYGVKGQPVLSAFFDMDDLSCRVCSFKANTFQLAILHQQQRRHLRS